ncbi:MAG: hypothetical protein ACREEM_04565 [Blastocatellia bacterium]
MRATALNNLLRPNRAYRVIAIFFLAFTFIDILYPWLCQEEMANLTGAVHAQKAPGANKQSDLAGDEGQNDRDSKPGALEEDCFCCCSHVQPSFGTGVSDTNVSDSVFLLPPANLPIPQPSGIDHPPRSASC